MDTVRFKIQLLIERAKGNVSFNVQINEAQRLLDRIAAAESESAALREQVDKLTTERDAANECHEHDHKGISAYAVALFGRSDIGYTDGVREITKLQGDLRWQSEENRKNGIAYAIERDSLRDQLTLANERVEAKQEAYSRCADQLTQAHADAAAMREALVEVRKVFVRYFKTTEMIDKALSSTSGTALLADGDNARRAHQTEFDRRCKVENERDEILARLQAKDGALRQAYDFIAGHGDLMENDTAPKILTFIDAALSEAKP